MSYRVDNEKNEIEASGLSLPDAIRRAVASGEDVYVHDDECKTTDKELGPDCPCHPFRIPGRRRASNIRRDRTPYRWG